LFGLFAKKPDARTQEMYGRYAHQASQVCMYLFQYSACPPQDGQEKVDLTIEDNRTTLVEEIVSRIDLLGIAFVDGEERAEIFRDMAQSDVSNASSISVAKSDAGMILTILNIIDMLGRHYYELYPEYKPMLEMINELAKICPTGMQVIFGDDLPVEVRRSFPHFSSLFEQNRANF
jgi:hypothetical protein